MKSISNALNVEASFAVSPSLILISFGKSNTETRFIRTQQSIHFEQLHFLEILSQQIMEHQIDVDTAFCKLNQVTNQSPRYAPWLRALCFGISSASSAILFFGGRWLEMVVSFVLGLAVSGLYMLACNFEEIARLLEPTAAIFVSFICHVLHAYVRNYICVYSIVLSSIIWLLPGLSLTIAVTEITTRNIIGGTSRMLYALLNAFKLGLGVTLGWQLVTWVPQMDVDQCIPLPIWIRAFFFFGVAIPFNVLLQASPKQWPMMLTISGVGYSISTAASLWFSMEISSALASFGVGIISGLYSRITNHPCFVVTLSGILMLVPGAIGVRGVSVLLADNFASGIELSIMMITVSISITMGLFLANVVVFPDKMLKKQSKTINTIF